MLDYVDEVSKFKEFSTKNKKKAGFRNQIEENKNSF